MFRPALLSLLALAAGAAPVAAQTGTNTTGAISVAPRPAPRIESEAPAKPTMSGQLVNFTRGFMQVQTQYTGNLISDTFAAALQRSRDTVRPNSKPIPDEVKRELIPFYPASLLENVQYTIGDTSQAGLAGFAIRNGNAAAVTLIDTIVFKDEKYVSSLALWAHEIHHVQQYKDWGLGGFAQKYAFSWNEVEAEYLERMDRRDRLRLWGGYVHSLVAIIPMIFFIWSTWYLYTHFSEIMGTMMEQSARSAAAATGQGYEDVLKQIREAFGTRGE